MAELKDIIGYICENYPIKNELSNARLTKMVYLSDWKSAISSNKQISDIKWVFNHFGPYVDDVYNCAKSNKNFKITHELNVYGNDKYTICVKDLEKWSSLSKDDKDVIDHVILETKKLYWKDFIKLVYSTFPILVSERQSDLNLKKLARRYKEEVLERGNRRF